MLRINLLKPASAKSAPAPAAPSGGGKTFSTRREARLGLALLVAGGAVLFYLASRRTVVPVPSPPAAPQKAEAISSPLPEQLPQTPPPASPVPTPAPKIEPSSPAPKTVVTPPKPAGPQGTFQLTEISIRQEQGALILLARIGPGDLKYQTMKLENPNRLVIDLANCRLAAPRAQYSRPVEHPQVKRVRMSQFREDPPLTRIVLDLAAFPRYQIRPDPQGLEIKVLDGRP